MQLDLALIRDRTPEIAISGLLLLFLMSLPRCGDIARSRCVLLILLGLVYLPIKLGQVTQTTPLERLFLLALVVNFPWIALTFYLSGEPGRGASFSSGRHFYFPLLIPPFFPFRKVHVGDSLIRPVYFPGSFFEDRFEGKSATMFVSIMLPLWLARPGLDRSGVTADA